MNTVGKKGKLGEQVRCVVSRRRCSPRAGTPTLSRTSSASAPFGSQLLCEQVVGRGLRRRSYAVERSTGYSSRSTPTSTASRSSSSPSDKPSRTRAAEAGRSRSRPSRAASDLRITFPKLDRLPGRAARRGHLARPRATRPGSRSDRTRSALGRDAGRRRCRRTRASTRTTRDTARRRSPSRSPSASSTPAVQHALDDKRPWLFPELVEMCRTGSTRSVDDRRRLPPRSTCMTITEAQVAGGRADLERDHPSGRQPPRAAAAR